MYSKNKNTVKNLNTVVSKKNIIIQVPIKYLSLKPRLVFLPSLKKSSKGYKTLFIKYFKKFKSIYVGFLVITLAYTEKPQCLPYFEYYKDEKLPDYLQYLWYENLG